MNRSNRTGLLLALCGLALSPAAFAQKHDMHAMMDSDGNGAISAAEHAAAAQKMFAKADANGDGSVGADEMKAMHQQMMERMRQCHDTMSTMMRHMEEMGARHRTPNPQP